MAARRVGAGADLSDAIGLRIPQLQPVLEPQLGPLGGITPSSGEGRQVAGPRGLGIAPASSSRWRSTSSGDGERERQLSLRWTATGGLAEQLNRPARSTQLQRAADLVRIEHDDDRRESGAAFEEGKKSDRLSTS